MTPDNREEQVREALPERVLAFITKHGGWGKALAHIEALEARELALSEQVATVTGWCASANQRAEAAEARVRELEGDAARLDWLDRAEYIALRGGDNIGTDRAAIDSAMQGAEVRGG